MSRLLALISLIPLALLLFTPCVASSQSVQAITSVRDGVIGAERDSILILAAKRASGYRSIHTLMRDSTGDQLRLRDMVGDAMRAADAVLESRNDSKEFHNAIVRFNEAERRLTGAMAAGGRPSVVDIQMGPIQAQGLPLPQAHTLVPDIVFTTGPELAFGNNSVLSMGISTNLLGEAAGAAFDILGSESLKNYFSQNVSAGTTIPTAGSGKLSGQLGLGLGGINLTGATIWPVLGMEQIDTADARIPSELKQLKPGITSWSSPLLYFAFVPYDIKTLESKLKAGGFVLVPMIGLRLPYYYADNPFSALAAILTSKRSEFVKTGKTQFVVGLSIPLLKVKPGT
jgi:hypothetical protein